MSRNLAVLETIAAHIEDRKLTGKTIVELNTREGGIGNYKVYNATKVPPGHALMITGKSSDVLEVIATK